MNSTKTLTNRFEQCIAERQRVPDVLAVNFTAIGDLYKTVNLFNAAIARRTGVTPAINRVVRHARATGALTEAQLADLEALRRLPDITDARAQELLGVAGDHLLDPAGLSKLVVDETASGTTTTTTPPPEEPTTVP